VGRQTEAGTLVRYARQIMALDEEMTEHERRVFAKQLLVVAKHLQWKALHKAGIDLSGVDKKAMKAMDDELDVAFKRAEARKELVNQIHDGLSLLGDLAENRGEKKLASTVKHSWNQLEKLGKGIRSEFDRIKREQLSEEIKGKRTKQ